MTDQNRQSIIKTALYRSLHRGCKETDILLGIFATKKINDFDEVVLSLYCELILEDDVYIYDWILQKVAVPEKYEDLIADIRQFHDL
ncbi:MAG: antitoxin CptB [Rickettsiales bacterium]|jgi:antitoxin CptB